MRKKLTSEEYESRALKREIKKRPKMPQHGRSLKRPSKYAAGNILKETK